MDVRRLLNIYVPVGLCFISLGTMYFVMPDSIENDIYNEKHNNSTEIESFLRCGTDSLLKHSALIWLCFYIILSLFGLYKFLHRMQRQNAHHPSASEYIIQNASEYIKQDWLNSEQGTKTSIIAIEFDGGVVISAISRGITAAYIFSSFANKIKKITKYVYCCCPDPAANMQAFSDEIVFRLKIYRHVADTEILVETVAELFRKKWNDDPHSLVVVSDQIWIAGWDKEKGGQVYRISKSGTGVVYVRQPISIDGSSLMYDYVNEQYHSNMTKDQCLKLLRNTLALAMAHDDNSGGVIQTGVITKKGGKIKVILGNKSLRSYKRLKLSK